MVLKTDIGPRTPQSQASPQLQQLRRNMETVMGPMPGEERRVSPELVVEHSETLPGFTRHLVSFATEKDHRIQAYLLVPSSPKGEGGATPAMLCLHQTTHFMKEEPAGLGGLPNLHYAAHLAERGYVTLAPDYQMGRHFETPGVALFDPYAHGYESATMAGIWNHRAALDVLQGLEAVDAERIGVIGHSLGGHNALFLAAFDDRVKVIVSSCGYAPFRSHDPNVEISAWSHSGYMPRIKNDYGCDPSRMPFDFPELTAQLAPRAFFTNAPLQDEFDYADVKACLDHARESYREQDAVDRLGAIHPDCAHDFPSEARDAAYAFIDQWL